MIVMAERGSMPSDSSIERRKETGGRILAVKNELLGMNELPEVHKERLQELFAGKSIPTDGDTFITLPSPYGGFLTVDQVADGGVVIAWHELTRLERGRVEAIHLSSGDARYREYEKPSGITTFPKGVFKQGVDALCDIDSFRSRRLRGESA